MADSPNKEASTKEASGILIYLVEELGDARLRASQLKQYVASALELVEESKKKDHIYEVAADLLHGIPDTLFKLEKALDAAAMAASRMDYEEIKQGLKPEKAEELERVLEDVRLQYLKRRSDPMSAKKAAEVMETMAEAIEATGEVPKEELASLIAEFEEGNKQASRKSPTEFFREAAEYVRSSPRPDFQNLAASMRRILADNLEVESARKPTSVPDKHQLKILRDTVRNPMKYLLGGPNAEEAEEILREKFQYTDAEIKRLKMASDEVESGALYEKDKQQTDQYIYNSRKNVREEKELAALVMYGTGPNKPLFPMKPEHAEEILQKKYNYSASDLSRLKRASDEVEAGAGEEFKKVNPKITDKEVVEINEMHEKHKDVVKEKNAGSEDLYQWFDDAFTAAKLARQAAQNGMGRKAALEALESIRFMCLAASQLSPKYTVTLTRWADKVDLMRGSILMDAARALRANHKTASQEGVLADFEAAFTAAKMSRANAEQGNERKAAFFGLHAVDAMVKALAALAPKYADKLLMLSDKAQMLRAGVVSDAAHTGALSSGVVVEAPMPVMARYEKGKPADPTENMSEEDAAEWEDMNEQHRDNFKSATMGRSARLMARQEAILKKYVEAGGNSMSFDELPVTVQTALQRVKDQETLWSDVDRWLSDNNNPHLKRGLFASDDDNKEEQAKEEQKAQQKQAGRYGQPTRRRLG